MVKMKLNLEKRFRGNPLLFVSMMLLILIPSFTIAISMSPHTIQNDITAVMTVYADDNDGNYHVVVGDDRTYTVVKVVATLDNSAGLTELECSLYTTTDTGERQERMDTISMTTINPLLRECEFNVMGYSTGVYLVHLVGQVSTHPVEIPGLVMNPDYETWEDWEQALLQEYMEQTATDVMPISEFLNDRLTEAELEYYYNPPIEWIDGFNTELKDDVDLILPADKRIYIKNPNKEMVYTFSMEQTALDSEITFSYTILTGDMDSCSMSIYNALDNTRIIGVPDISTFVFNENKGQSDGEYYATMHMIGAIGWTGVAQRIDFIIDNPDSIGGIVNIYVLEDGLWQIAEDILKGDIKIEVTNIVGNPSNIYITFNGPIDISFDFYHLTDSNSYVVIVDTMTLLNGGYDVDVIAVRSEDNALCYLSAFDVGVTGSSTTPVVLILGLLGVMGIITVGIYTITGGFDGKKGKRMRE